MKQIHIYTTFEVEVYAASTHTLLTCGVRDSHIRRFRCTGDYKPETVKFETVKFENLCQHHPISENPPYHIGE